MKTSNRVIVETCHHVQQSVVTELFASRVYVALWLQFFCLASFLLDSSLQLSIMLHEGNNFIEPLYPKRSMQLKLFLLNESRSFLCNKVSGGGGTKNDVSCVRVNWSTLVGNKFAAIFQFLSSWFVVYIADLDFQQSVSLYVVRWTLLLSTHQCIESR